MISQGFARLGGQRRVNVSHPGTSWRKLGEWNRFFLLRLKFMPEDKGSRRPGVRKAFELLPIDAEDSHGAEE